MGPFRTYVSLIKGFVGTGLLFLPHEFKNGGWLFSGVALFLAYVYTTISLLKLVESTIKTETNSFKDVGMKALGIKGRYAIEIFLVIT